MANRDETENGDGLSRRALLRGAGVSLALPLLDAMLPMRTRAAGKPSGVPRRMVAIQTNMGFCRRTFFRRRLGKIMR